MTNGAENLIRSLAHAGVDVCFANPATSEMHLVQAIDAVSEVRPVTKAGLSDVSKNAVFSSKPATQTPSSSFAEYVLEGRDEEGVRG